MRINLKKLAKELAGAYKEAAVADIEDDVSLCRWVRQQTNGTYLTLAQADKLRNLLDGVETPPTKGVEKSPTKGVEKSPTKGVETPTKVIIFVEGGVVQSCTSNDKKLVIVLVDRDALEQEEDPEDAEDAITEEHPDCVHEVY